MVGAGDKPLADTAGQLGMGESCIRGNSMSGDGVYHSHDDGATWRSLSLNLPDLPVSDLVVEARDLAISTHGRGF
jgi:hypothetical protein